MEDHHATGPSGHRDVAVRRTITFWLAIAIMTLSTACGGPSQPADTSTKKIAITFTGDSVTPNGSRVNLSVNQPVELDVTAEKPGQLHVHSSPDHTFDYKAGETTFTFAIDRPGIVDVESHDLSEIIVQLVVQ